MYKLFIHAGSGNHGCEAIVRTTSNILDNSVILYSRKPELDKKYGIDKICKIEFDEQKILERGSREWMVAALQSKLFGKIDLTIRYQFRNLLDNINREDICLSIGGDNYCYPGTDLLAAINRQIVKKGAKLILWGCSVEPELIKQSEIATDLSRFDLITARESISYNALRKINRNVVLVSDPAFTLETKELPLPPNWMENKMVGINASPLILQSGKDSSTVYMAYKMLIKEILFKTDFGVVLIPHVVCEGNDDLILLKKLYDEFADTKRVVLIGDHNCMELKGYIARCRFFVGARTHATIAAYSSYVPTLVLGYSVKSKGIATDLFGTDEHYVLPVQRLTNPEDLIREFNWILDHESLIKTHLKKIMPEYISRAFVGKEAVEKLTK